MGIKEIEMRFLKRLFCRHDLEFVRNIYGDEINEWGWKRSIWRCKHCSKLIGRNELVPNDQGKGRE